MSNRNATALAEAPGGKQKFANVAVVSDGFCCARSWPVVVATEAKGVRLARSVLLAARFLPALRSHCAGGRPGTAKTATVNQFLSKLNPDQMSSKTITFSSLTTPKIFQASIEGAVEKRQGRTFGPAGGKRMVVFVDDVSMPSVNVWGDQVGTCCF